MDAGGDQKKEKKGASAFWKTAHFALKGVPDLTQAGVAKRWVFSALQDKKTVWKELPPGLKTRMVIINYKNTNSEAINADKLETNQGNFTLARRAKQIAF